MEPVPETERMEEFRRVPAPRTLRPSIVTDSSFSESSPVCYSSPNLSLETATFRNPPPVTRRSTDPSPHSPPLYQWPSPLLPYRPRNASPLSATSGSSLSPPSSYPRSRSAAPNITRAQSLSSTSGSLFSLHRPSSPASSGPSLSGSPESGMVRGGRFPPEDIYPASPVRQSVLNLERGPATELTLSPNAQSPYTVATPSWLSIGPSTPRYRRPLSPFRLHSTSLHGSSDPPSSASSPLYRPVDSSSSSSFGIFSSSLLAPLSHVSSLPSVPTTPTSVRSRSPSISSLETIPDSPDAEEAALEADRVAMLKSDGESDDPDPSDLVRGRMNLDSAFTRGRTLGFGTRDKRKRWSVCGAERRGDLDLETIWED